jgi:hypothetical protein
MCLLSCIKEVLQTAIDARAGAETLVDRETFSFPTATGVCDARPRLSGRMSAYSRSRFARLLFRYAPADRGPYDGGLRLGRIVNNLITLPASLACSSRSLGSHAFAKMTINR